jgi:hypothetical protein
VGELQGVVGMIKYKTQYNTISEIEILKETSTQIVRLDGTRENKRLYWHDSWEEARRLLLEQAKDKVNEVSFKLTVAMRDYQDVLEMENPTK